MNAVPLSLAGPLVDGALKPDRIPPRGRSRLGKLRWASVICFLFGGMLATQLRASEQFNVSREVRGQRHTAHGRIQEMQICLISNAAVGQQPLDRTVYLRNFQHSYRLLIPTPSWALKSEITKLREQACLTRVTGEGVRVVLADSVEIDRSHVGPHTPGAAHDLDILAVVNELRAWGAEAIAVNGSRVTGYTAIRATGSTILVNWRPVSPPYRVDAVGHSQTLDSGLSMPGGAVDRLRNDLALSVRVTPVRRLDLPPAGSIPSFQFAKPIT